MGIVWMDGHIIGVSDEAKYVFADDKELARDVAVFALKERCAEAARAETAACSSDDDGTTGPGGK